MNRTNVLQTCILKTHLIINYRGNTIMYFIFIYNMHLWSFICLNYSSGLKTTTKQGYCFLYFDVQQIIRIFKYFFFLKLLIRVIYFVLLNLLFYDNLDMLCTSYSYPCLLHYYLPFISYVVSNTNVGHTLREVWSWWLTPVDFLEHDIPIHTDIYMHGMVVL